jgi:hypothetical protein
MIACAGKYHGVIAHWRQKYGYFRNHLGTGIVLCSCLGGNNWKSGIGQMPKMAKLFCDRIHDQRGESPVDRGAD